MDSSIADHVKGENKRKILEFICANKGARHTDIQRFIVENLLHLDYSEKDSKGRLKHRGRYSTRLYGYGQRRVGYFGEQGIYKAYCNKVNKKYYIKKEFLKNFKRVKTKKELIADQTVRDALKALDKLTHEQILQRIKMYSSRYK